MTDIKPKTIMSEWTLDTDIYGPVHKLYRYDVPQDYGDSELFPTRTHKYQPWCQEVYVTRTTRCGYWYCYGLSYRDPRFKKYWHWCQRGSRASKYKPSVHAAQISYEIRIDRRIMRLKQDLDWLTKCRELLNWEEAGSRTISLTA